MIEKNKIARVFYILPIFCIKFQIRIKKKVHKKFRKIILNQS